MISCHFAKTFQRSKFSLYWRAVIHPLTAPQTTLHTYLVSQKFTTYMPRWVQHECPDSGPLRPDLTSEGTSPNSTVKKRSSGELISHPITSYRWMRCIWFTVDVLDRRCSDSILQVWPVALSIFLIISAGWRACSPLGWRIGVLPRAA